MSETVTNHETNAMAVATKGAVTTKYATMVRCELVPLVVCWAPICVLFVHPSPPTDASVLDAFARHPRAISGRVDTTSLESTARVNAWLHDRQKALGWPPSPSFPNGYYLFIDGEVRAYHAAARTADDLC